MHILLAIANITFKDAIRKKVLLTIFFFALLLVAVSGFLPWVRPADQIRQVTKVCLGGIAFFGMVVAIFLTAPSLPDDIRKKTIFTVMTKPARRWQILAGKILGMGYVLAVMLAVMGAIAFGYIRFWAWKMGEGPAGTPRLQSNKQTWAKSIDYEGIRLDLSPWMIKSNRAIASGFERITYNFENLDLRQFPSDTVFAEVKLFSHGFSYDKTTKEGTAALQAKNPSTGETSTEIFGAETLRPKHIGFPKAMIDENGRLSITLIRRLKTGSYSALASSVSVLSAPSGYGVNFIKALVMMFMQYMVLVFVAITASTFLTSTVSTITALFVYFTGSLTQILRAQALKLGSEANIFTMAEHHHHHGGAQEEHVISGMQLVINYLLRYFYLGLSVIFPNLSTYDPSDSICAGHFIPFSTLWSAFAYGAVYATVMFVIALAIFRRKEVA